MTLREYQSKSVDFLQPRRRAMCVAPAGAGKTVIAAAAAAKKAEAFARVVWLANTIEQCEQARKACVAWSWQDPVVIDVHCVAARPDVSGADIIIIDECHHLPARTWWTTVATTEATVWGFTATPWTGDWQRDGVIKAFFGEENFITIPRSEVLAGGSITMGSVVINDLDTPGEFDFSINEKASAETAIRCRKFPNITRDEHQRRCRWKFTIEALIENPARNTQIIKIAGSESQSVLILVASVDHGKSLHKKISGSELIFSKIGKKKRADAIEAFKSGGLKIMISTSLADEGLDVPRAAVLILAAGGRSAVKLEQRSGRVMRPFDGKKLGIIHDFSDTGSVMARAQFISRARTYKKLGYNISYA